MISVIIPVYNVEKYLDRCLDSIVNQTYRDLEIILIDDGSTDSSPQICDEWAKRDFRIRVIHKVNEGQGIARNVGLDVAAGDWITFVDSDDYLDTSTYAVCMEKIAGHDAEVCYFGVSGVSASGIVRRGKPRFPETMQETEIRKKLLPLCFGRLQEDSIAVGSACIGIYSRNMIEANAIRFYSERQLISEDYVFTADICTVAKKIAFVNEGFYYYCVNPMSTTHRFQPNRFEKSVVFHENRMEEIERLGLGEETKLRAIIRYWIMVLAAVKSDVGTDELPFRAKIKRLHMIMGHPVSTELNNRNVRRKMNKKIRLFMIMMKIKSALGVYILVLLKKKHPEW